MHMELLQPRKERAWGWPAVANFIFAGSGAGFYLLFSFLMFIDADAPSGVIAGAAGLLSPALVLLGFLAVSLEAGKPLRGRYMLYNLGSSWMSTEILAGSLFIFSAIIGRFFPATILQVTAACAALGLIISHGFILYRARAMTAWNVRAIPLLFISSALALGGGILFIMSGLLQARLGRISFTSVLICLLVDMIAWASYVWGSQDIPVRKATDFLRRPLTLSFVTGLGHLVPSCLLIALMITLGASESSWIRRLLVTLTGCCILAGGAIQKIVIILGANFMRGITIHVPDNNAPAVKVETTSARTGTGRERGKTSADSARH